MNNDNELLIFSSLVILITIKSTNALFPSSSLLLELLADKPIRPQIRGVNLA